MGDTPKIEQAVVPGEIPYYPHPANMPLCMVHGHKPDKIEFATVTLLLPDIYSKPITESVAGIVSCRVCGTVYTPTGP